MPKILETPAPRLADRLRDEVGRAADRRQGTPPLCLRIASTAAGPLALPTMPSSPVRDSIISVNLSMRVAVVDPPAQDLAAHRIDWTYVIDDPVFRKSTGNAFPVREFVDPLCAASRPVSSFRRQQPFTGFHEATSPW